MNRSPTTAQSGFTLLEVCVAITIGMLIIGAATLGISSVGEEHRLRKTASVIEATARATLQRAVTDHRNVFIEFSQDRIMATASEGVNAGEYDLGGKLQIRRYGEKEFRTPRSGELWQFSADGLCEPLEIRITQKKGSIEMSFDPLTGCARKKSIIVQS